MENLDQNLFRLINLATEFMNSRKCFDKFVVSKSELNFITTINMSAPCPLKALAECLELTNSACSQQVDKLVKKGFVERVTDENDRRSLKLALTKEGLEIITHYRNCQSNLVQSVEKKLGQFSKENYTSVIKAIADTLEEKIKEHEE